MSIYDPYLIITTFCFLKSIALFYIRKIINLRISACVLGVKETGCNESGSGWFGGNSLIYSSTI